MLQMTIREALADPDYRRSIPEHFRLYLIGDDETIFYIGQSVNPHNRLLSHLGMDGRATRSSIGDFLIRHAPASGAWLFTQYTVDDCVSFVDQYRATLPEKTQALYLTRYDVDFAEEALIQIHRPHFNTAMNPNPRPLPEKYQKTKEDNPYSEKLTARFGFKRKRRA